MTGTDLEPFDAPVDEATLVVHPLTGEAIDLCHAPDEDLARFLDGLDDDRDRIQGAKRIVSDEALRRMDKAAAWTRRAGPYQLTASSSPEPATQHGEKRRMEYVDGAALRSDLLELVDEDVVSIEAVDAAVETEVIYKVKKGGLGKLRKLGGRVAEIIDRHAFTSEKTRYVTVKRADR